MDCGNEDADELVRSDGDLDIVEAAERGKPGDGMSLGVRVVLEVSNEEVVLRAMEDCEEDLLGITKPLGTIRRCPWPALPPRLA
jgi:hypothetical protein